MVDTGTNGGTATITTTEFELRPQERSGIVVKFPLEFTHSAVVLMVGADGKPVPVGSVAVLDATHVKTPVGFGGQTYLEHLQPHNTVTVRLDEKTCTVEFNYVRLSGDIPTIGPLTCAETKP